MAYRLKALTFNAIISNNTFKVTICDIKNKDSNMADITEKTGNSLFTHLYGGRREKKTGNVFR